MRVPLYTADLIIQLKKEYLDQMVIEPDEVGTPEYWMKAGIIDLIRILEASATGLALNNKSA